MLGGPSQRCGPECPPSTAVSATEYTKSNGREMLCYNITSSVVIKLPRSGSMVRRQVAVRKTERHIHASSLRSPHARHSWRASPASPSAPGPPTPRTRRSSRSPIPTSCRRKRRSKRTLALQPNTNRAKNVILFVGDGLGVSTVTAARIFEGQQRGADGEFERARVRGLAVRGALQDLRARCPGIRFGADRDGDAHRHQVEERHDRRHQCRSCSTTAPVRWPTRWPPWPRWRRWRACRPVR